MKDNIKTGFLFIATLLLVIGIEAFSIFSINHTPAEPGNSKTIIEAPFHPEHSTNVDTA